jgi:hypothetical protein
MSDGSRWAIWHLRKAGEIAADAAEGKNTPNSAGEISKFCPGAKKGRARGGNAAQTTFPWRRWGNLKPLPCPL